MFSRFNKESFNSESVVGSPIDQLKQMKNIVDLAKELTYLNSERVVDPAPHIESKIKEFRAAIIESGIDVGGLDEVQVITKLSEADI